MASILKSSLSCHGNRSELEKVDFEGSDKCRWHELRVTLVSPGAVSEEDGKPPDLGSKAESRD